MYWNVAAVIHYISCVLLCLLYTGLYFKTLYLCMYFLWLIQLLLTNQINHYYYQHYIMKHNKHYNVRISVNDFERMRRRPDRDCKCDQCNTSAYNDWPTKYASLLHSVWNAAKAKCILTSAIPFPHRIHTLQCGTGSGISWTVCKSFAPRSRQITTPAPNHSSFYGPTNGVKALKALPWLLIKFLTFPEPFCNPRTFQVLRLHEYRSLWV